MSITEENAGWSFIHKGTRYERPTREQAQELLYDLQRDKTPAPPADYAETRRAACHAVDEALAPVVTYARKQLTDGSSPNGWDEYSCGGTIVAIEDNAVYLFSRDQELGEWEPAELAALEALLSDPRVQTAIALAEARAAA